MTTISAGHVYLELAELKVTEFEAVLKDVPVRDQGRSDTTKPEWLFGTCEKSKIALETADVRVSLAAEELQGSSSAESLICSKRVSKRRDEEHLTPLTLDEINLLVASPKELAETYAQSTWPKWQKAEQVQFANRKREDLHDNEMRREDNVIVKLAYDDQSSDDSDAVDSESAERLPIAGENVDGSLSKGRSCNQRLRNVIARSPLSAYDFRSLHSVDNPLPQLLIHGFLHQRKSRREIRDIEEKKDLLGTLHTKYRSYPAANEFAAVLGREIRRSRELGNFVEIVKQSRVETEDIKLLDSTVSLLNCPKLKALQAEVCLHAERLTENIYFVAPCNYGKSLCFLVPAARSGGVTLVVEPLKALISSQLKTLREKPAIRVESLLTRDESIATCKPAASDRLNELANCWCTSEPATIIFSTPELIAGSMNALSTMFCKGILKRIVIDEFDVIEDSREGYRDSYINLIPRIRKHCNLGGKTVPITCLSATVTKSAILESIGTGPKPLVYLSDRALPDNQSYNVERKLSSEQVE